MLGTMNVVKRQSLSEEAISRLIDPRTGQRLRPLGVVGGRAVWPMMGASPDDPSNKDDEDDDKETKDEEDNPEGSESDEEDGGSDKGDPQSKIAALEDEKKRHVRRRQEAERERDEFKARLEALESKDKPEQERLQTRVTELESENETLSALIRDVRLENAFLSDNTYSWHNPRRALKLADLSEVEIDSDGTVHGLKGALERLAKSDAYLLKTTEKKDETKEQPSTSTPKSKSKKDQTEDKTEDKALLDKYPALRR